MLTSSDDHLFYLKRMNSNKGTSIKRRSRSQMRINSHISDIYKALCCGCILTIPAWAAVFLDRALSSKDSAMYAIIIVVSSIIFLIFALCCYKESERHCRLAAHFEHYLDEVDV